MQASEVKGGGERAFTRRTQFNLSSFELVRAKLDVSEDISLLASSMSL